MGVSSSEYATNADWEMPLPGAVVESVVDNVIHEPPALGIHDGAHFLSFTR